MTPTDLLDIMRESGLPKWTWGCEPSGAEGLWLSYAGTLLQIDEAAALCEVRLFDTLARTHTVCVRTIRRDGALTFSAWCQRLSEPDGRGYRIIEAGEENPSRLHAAVMKEKA